MGRSIIGLLGLGAIAYISACLALLVGQSRLIFLPRPDLTTTPAELGLAHQDVWISMDEGYLHGWWLPASDPQAKTVLFLHGNGGNVGSHLQQAWFLSQVGWSVLLIDYRGYGLSSGPFPNETRVYEDAAAAWDYLTQTQNQAPENIIIFGHSIGGAIAIELAHRHPQAAGLIVQGTFTSMAAMVDHIGYSRIFPRWLLTQRFNSQQKLSTLQMPVLLIHGSEDETIPATMSQDLYAIAPQPKQLWLVPGASHNNVPEVAGPHYIQTLQRWLSSIHPTEVAVVPTGDR